MSRTDFAGRLLAWFDEHGRHDLPWQHPRSAYRVWVSEIMLQQTQVTTVIPYFERFMDRFPDVGALASAPADDVLHLWSGLGYYARARNLHLAARVIVAVHDGRFPSSIDEAMALPGIGRSTAGAILAQARGERHPILDGNVRRVLARYHGIEEWPGKASVERRLWQHAESHTPHERVADYTQAVMDLGATVCRRAKPDCDACPLAADCVARREGRQAELPARRPRPARPLRSTCMLIVRDPSGRVLLERRTGRGVWQGLWSFPESANHDEAGAWCVTELGREPAAISRWPEVRHGFSHYELEITPVHVELGGPSERLMDGDDRLWYNPGAPAAVGLASVVSRLLSQLPDARSPT